MLNSKDLNWSSIKTQAAEINGDYYNSVTLTLEDLFEIANVPYPGHTEALQ